MAPSGKRQNVGKTKKKKVTYGEFFALDYYLSFHQLGKTSAYEKLIETPIEISGDEFENLFTKTEFKQVQSLFKLILNYNNREKIQNLIAQDIQKTRENKLLS